MRKTLIPLLAILALPVSLPVSADEVLGPEAAATMPIFDAHVHYKQPAWEAYPPEVILEMFDRNRVAMALVSSTPDEGTIMLWEHAPVRVIPELRPYRGPWRSSNWLTYDAVAGYLEERLDAYPHEGIGEFHVNNIETANKDLLRRIAEMAVERDILVHIHSGAEPVRFLFEVAPELTVIWAHAGMSSPPQEIGPLMDKHARLFADTSYRESDILDGPGLDPDWKALLARHPDRFMLGSDTWVNGQWASYDGIIGQSREILALLPPDMARMIAYENAEKLFGRKVDAGLIGQR